MVVVGFPAWIVPVDEGLVNHFLTAIPLTHEAERT